MGYGQSPFLRSTGSVVTLPQGALLFQEGRRSGSLYIVKKGSIDLFTEASGEDVALGSIGPGEVLGFMACLVDEPRPTSAKVGQDLVAVAIDREDVRQVLSGLPPWFSAGIKAMTQYVKDMRRECEALKAQVARARKERQAELHAAAQVAATLAGVGATLARNCDGRKVIAVEDALTTLESLLLRPRDALKKTFDLFFDSGLLRMEIEPDRKQKVVDLDIAVRRLQFFVQFTSSRLTAKTKRLLRTTLSHRERRMLLGLAKYAQVKKLELTATQRFPVAQLAEEFQPAVREPFDPEVLVVAEKAGLVQLEGRDEAQRVVVCPVALTQTLAALEIVRKLSAAGPGSRPEGASASFPG